MTLAWWLRTWPDDEGESRPEDEPAEPELADEEADRVERNRTKHY